MVSSKNFCACNFRLSSDFYLDGPVSPRIPSPPRAPSAPVATGMWAPNEGVMNSLIAPSEDLFEEPGPSLGSSADGLVRNFAPLGRSGVVTRRPRRGMRRRAFRRSVLLRPKAIWPYGCLERVRRPCPFGRWARSTRRGLVRQVNSWDWEHEGGWPSKRKFAGNLEGWRYVTRNFD